MKIRMPTGRLAPKMSAVTRFPTQDPEAGTSQAMTRRWCASCWQRAMRLRNLAAMNRVQEVCIRPRKVFRALADTPVGPADYALSAAQGIALALFFSRMKNMGLTAGFERILLQAIAQGTLSGIAVIWLQSWLYTWLGRQTGGVAKRPAVMHVLAYGSAPLLITLTLGCLSALFLGVDAFVAQPRDPEFFETLIGAVLTAGFLLPALWSVILQVMGLSEVHRVRFRGALGTWLLGQALQAVLSLLFLYSVGMPLPNG